MKQVFLLLFILISFQGISQFSIQGKVVDRNGRRPLEAVSVLTTSGRFAITDSSGIFDISVRRGDSIWFSFLGKNTLKYPVDTITNISNFEIALHIDARYLPEVTVRNRSYKMDSLQNREDYAKYFNFKKPGFSLTPNPTYVPGSVSVGLDLQEFINMFRFKRNKRILALQERLIEQEQQKYIDHRFSKRFVRQLTKLNSPELESFMNVYRPGYDLLQLMNDLELGVYIQKAFEEYNRKKLTGNISRPDLSPAQTRE